MSDEKKIEPDQLNKALSVLQDLAKGHSSKGTNTTEVFSQTGEGGSTQVHHTASDSDPNGWAGSNFRDVKENGASDAIGEDGTDYNGGAEMVKSIHKKMAAGQTLSADEVKFVMEKGMPSFMKKDDDKDDKDKDKDVKKACDYDDDDKDKKDDVKKSLADEAAANETVANGMEISEFLADFVGVFNKSMNSMEARQDARMDKLAQQITASDVRGEEFGKSLAGAMGALGEGLAAQGQRVDQIEATPARGPKSQQLPADLNKSFGGPDGETLSKAVVAATLVDMAENKKISVQDVLRFDSTGDITDETLQAVHAHRAGR